MHRAKNNDWHGDGVGAMFHTLFHMQDSRNHGHVVAFFSSWATSHVLFSPLRLSIWAGPLETAASMR